MEKEYPFIINPHATIRKTIVLKEKQARKLKLWKARGYNPSAVLRYLIDQAPENWENME